MQKFYSAVRRSIACYGRTSRFRDWRPMLLRADAYGQRVRPNPREDVRAREVSSCIRYNLSITRVSVIASLPLHSRARFRFMLAFLMQYKISILEMSRTLVMPYKTVYYMAEKLRGSIFAQKIVRKLEGHGGDGPALPHRRPEGEKRPHIATALNDPVASIQMCSPWNIFQPSCGYGFSFR